MQSVRVLSPRPPVRALAIAAAAEGVGVLLIVAGGSWRWPGFPVLGWIFVVLGAALAVAALLAQRRQRVRVEFTDDGYTIVAHGATQEGLWSEVTKVTQGPNALVLHHGDERRVRLIDPTGAPGALDRLAQDIGRHLDRSRGYGA